MNMYYHVFVPGRLIGRTTGFGPVNLGSSPSPAATEIGAVLWLYL